MRVKSGEDLVEIELILDEQRMHLVERAAAYSGQSVDQFVLATALARSEEVLRAREQPPRLRRRRRAQGDT